MNLFIPTLHWGLLEQEQVKVIAIFCYKDLRFAIHRPEKSNKYCNEIWVISEFETGLQLCRGMNSNYLRKKAEKLLSKHYQDIIEKKNKHFNKFYRCLDLVP